MPNKVGYYGIYLRRAPTCDVAVKTEPKCLQITLIHTLLITCTMLVFPFQHEHAQALPTNDGQQLGVEGRPLSL